MPVARRIQPTSFEDFCLLVKDGQKADLIDGVIYMASPDNTDANDLFVWLISLIHGFVDFLDLGKVYGSRVAFKLSATNSPEPDIGFVRKRRLTRVRRGHVQGHPDLAIEIVSPESVDRDYILKRGQFERFGVPEYWIIDEMRRIVTFLILDRGGKYREAQPTKGKFHSRVLTGFWVQPEWFWPETRPRMLDVLQEILANVK